MAETRIGRRVRAWDDDADPGLPLKLWPCSNGEYLPPPLDELRAEAMRRARAAADHHARRHGWSRRRFLLSSAGMASGLAVLQACSDERSASESTEPGGRFTVPETAATDPEEATTTIHGEPDAGIVVDVQTHFLESGEWGTGFPQGACGEAEPIDCFSAEYWRDLVLAGSDTAVAVISADPRRRRGRPAVDRRHGARPGPGRRAVRRRPRAHPGPRRTRRRPARCRPGGDGRRRRRPRAVRVEGVHPCARRVVPRRPRPVGAARRRRRSCRRSATPACPSSPCTRASPAATPTPRPSTSARPPPPTPTSPSSCTTRASSPAAPRARTTPTAPASTASCAASPRPGSAPAGNVYAELGSTWRTVMGDPDQAAHVLGKLLVAFGPGAHPVGHGLDLVRLAAGPDRRLPQLRDHRRLPGAVRLPGTHARRQGAHPRGQRRRAVRHRPAGDVVPAGRGLRRPTARSARSPAATSRRRSCASTPGSPPPSADPRVCCGDAPRQTLRRQQTLG